MSSESVDLSCCAIHTQTNKPWTLQQCIEGYSRAGVRGICVWRHVLQPMGAAAAGKMLRDAGMRVPALVRGGFFVAGAEKSRAAALDENRRCIDEAQAVGAEMIVLVVGAVPGIPLAEARRQVTDGIAAIAPQAAAANVKLAIEPLHPMYAADRSCVNRMAEARHICEQIQSPVVGIACDVFHVWWDPELMQEIALAGQQKTLFGYHVCDWRANTRDLLNDRGLMGDGVIDLRAIRAAIDATGFRGMIEVEVFSHEYWEMDQSQYVQKITQAFSHFV